MSLLKTVALVVVAGAAGSMIAARVTPLVVSRGGATAANNAGAIQTGITAGSAAGVFVVLSSLL